MTTKFFKVVGIIGIILFSITSIGANAFETESGDSVDISEPRTNLHVSAGEVTVSSDITKDLVVAGGQVTIESNISRNLLAAGGQVDIQGQVGGASRIGGGEVILKGTFNDDVIIGAGQVTIKDSTINGDLVVGAGSLDLQNSQILGDVYAGYDEYSGDDLDEQVNGEIKETMFDKPSSEERESRGRSSGIAGLFFRELSALLGLAILMIFLGRRNRLHIPSLSFNSKFGLDILVGSVVILIIPLLLLIASVLFFPISLPLLAILIGSIFLSSLFLPIYIGNLLKNSSMKDTSIRTLVIGSYIALVLFHVLKVMFPPFQILNIILAIIVLGNFGFLLRKKYNAITTYLKKR